MAQEKATSGEPNAGGWTQEQIGGLFPKGCLVTPLSRNPDHIDAFVCGTDGKVYNSWWAAGEEWSGKDNKWGSIGGDFEPGSKVTAVARSADNLDIFVVGKDGKVYMSYWYTGGDWSGINNDWAALGGDFPTGTEIAAVSRSPDNIDLFAVGADGSVYTSYWYTGGDWSQWQSIGGKFPNSAKVDAVARSKDSLDVFVCGDDGRVYHSYWYTGGDWSGKDKDWNSIGGIFTPGTEVVAVARSPDNLDVFVVGTDGNVYNSYWYTGADWSGAKDNWGSIGGGFKDQSPLTVVARGKAKLDVFVSGSDNKVSHSSWEEGKDWSSWDVVTELHLPNAKVTAVARTEQNLDVFVCDDDGCVYVAWSSAGQ